MDSEKRRQFKEDGLKLVRIQGKPAIIDRLRGINIEQEHNLIQAKQSRLPASMRKLVVTRYERLKQAREKENHGT